MKNYTITVNGNVYDVTVEENGAGAPAAAPVAAPRAAAPAAPAAAPKAAAGAGSIQVKAGAAGKVFQVPTSVGQKVEAGDTVIIIEAMKMEIPVVAPEAGTIASICLLYTSDAADEEDSVDIDGGRITKKKKEENRNR